MLSVVRASRYGAPVLWFTLIIALSGTALAVVGRVSPLTGMAAAMPLMAAISVGVGLQSSGVFARPVMGAQTGRSEIALTFDDGPDPRWTPPLLDLLDARQQRATFFVIGARAAAQRELLADIERRGHELANHTWSHSYLTVFKTPRGLAHELTRTNDLIEAATGRRPRWFRPPVGLLSPRVPVGARMAKLDLVGWTATARDGVARTTTAHAVARLARALRPGAILVLHDAAITDSREPIACAVVNQLLDRMETAGLRSVTLSELCAPSRAAD